MASYPTSIWDGTMLGYNSLINKIDSSLAEPHIFHALALDLDSISNEIIAIQTHLTDKIDDLRVPVNAVKLSGSKPPTWTDYKGGQVLAFSDQAVEGNEEVIYFIAQLQHARSADSNIEPHVHWVGEDNTAGNVRWKLTHSWANIDSAFPSESTLTVDDANAETDIHNYASFGGITGTGKTRSSMLICSLRRNSSHANDTFTGKNAYLLEVDFHTYLSGIGDDFTP